MRWQLNHIPSSPQAWTAYETKRHDKLRKAMQGMFVHKPDKAHTMAVSYAHSLVPRRIKQSVIWEVYWTLRTEASNAIRRHTLQMRRLLDLRRKVNDFARLRVGNFEVSGQTKLDCEIFILALQVLACRR